MCRERLLLMPISNQELSVQSVTICLFCVLTLAFITAFPSFAKATEDSTLAVCAGRPAAASNLPAKPAVLRVLAISEIEKVPGYKYPCMANDGKIINPKKFFEQRKKSFKHLEYIATIKVRNIYVKMKITLSDYWRRSVKDQITMIDFAKKKCGPSFYSKQLDLNIYKNKTACRRRTNGFVAMSVRESDDDISILHCGKKCGLSFYSNSWKVHILFEKTHKFRWKDVREYARRDLINRTILNVFPIVK